MAITVRLKNFLLGGSVLRQQLVRGAIGSFALNATNKLLMLLASVLLARILGASGYGVYAAAVALVLLLSVPTSLGLPILLIRLLATYQLREQWGLIRGLLTFANQVVLGVGAVIGVTGALVVWHFADRLGADKSAALWWGMALLPFVGLGALRSAALRGLQHVVLGQIPDSLVMPGLLVGAVTGMVGGGRLVLGCSAGVGRCPALYGHRRSFYSGSIVTHSAIASCSASFCAHL